MAKLFNLAVAAGAAFVLAVLLTEVSGEVQCAGKDMNMNSTQKEQLMTCLGNFGVKSLLKMKSSDFPCFARCILTVRQFITDDNKVDIKKFMEHLEMVIVDKAPREALQGKITECIKNHGNNIQKDDKTCMSFMDITSCVKDVMFDICVTDD